eukprot:jgi/Tetstr1/451974/TSEL_039010.t1
MFYAAGAYTAAFIVLRSGISDLFVLLIASTLVTAVIGALVGAYLVRYRAIFFAMLNLAVSMVFFALLSKLYGITGGTDGLRVPVPTVLGMTLTKAGFDIVLFYVALALMAIIAGLGVQFLKSPLGHAVGAIHTNEVRLEYLGVSAWSVLLIAYTISAALAGLGGAIAAVSIGHVLPEYAYWTESGHLVLTAVLGGIGGVAGPFIGSIFLEIVHTVAVGVAHNAWNLIMGATLLLVIFFLPQGLYGLVTKIARQGIARAFQIPQLFTDQTVRSNLLLAIASRQGVWDGLKPLARRRYQEEADELLELLGLSAHADAIAGTLPEGLRKLADITLALALKPRLLLLDEPTSGVSALERFSIMETLMNAMRTKGLTALFVEHDMEIVERYADRVLVWNSGSILAQGKPAEVLQDPRVVETVVGVA